MYLPVELDRQLVRIRRPGRWAGIDLLLLPALDRLATVLKGAATEMLADLGLDCRQNVGNFLF